MINESRNVGIKEIRGDSRMGDIPVTNHFPTIQNSLPGPPSIKSNKE